MVENMKFELKNKNVILNIKEPISNNKVLADVTIGNKNFYNICLSIVKIFSRPMQLYLGGTFNKEKKYICVCDKNKDGYYNRKIADYLHNICPDSLASEFTNEHKANWED